ncbi:MAG: YIP1 family protein [Spirochaetales bacterium]|nr:YIP1 family protein [Spirochaetales bacterium]
MSFLRIWFQGLYNPAAAFRRLQPRPAPYWGLWAVLLRFVITAVTSILALRLLDRTPFHPSYLTFLATDRYYTAEIFFLPLYGLGCWLLASALVHLILRGMGKDSDFDWILNVVGFGLLIPMPATWLVDWISIALDIYGRSFTPLIHSLISLWEIALITIGLAKMEEARPRLYLLLAVLVKVGVYIPLAALFIR